MNCRNFVLWAALTGTCFLSAEPAVAQNPAIAADPTPDTASPAAMQSFQLPSHGVLLNAFVYMAAGARPHPTVILLHGFPGNERNLDLAQSIRRAGWNVLYFDYRGSWGSPGDFSFKHCIEDTQAAVAYLRDTANAARFRSDPKTIALIGHSMGGFMALQAGALDPSIQAIITISAADLGTSRVQNVPADKHDFVAEQLAGALVAEGMAPLAGTSAEKLANEVLAHAAEWNFVKLAPKLGIRPLLVITSDDGLTGTNAALVEAVKTAGSQQVKTVHIATDHAYSDHRIGLQEAVLDELARLSQR